MRKLATIQKIKELQINLSDKIAFPSYYHRVSLATPVILSEDVREAVKKLIDYVKPNSNYAHAEHFMIVNLEVIEKIKEIFGEKLT